MLKFYNNLLLLFVLLFLLLGQKGFAQTVSRHIVTDQFGYLPDAVKIAVIRDPVTGFDGSESFTPGNTYAVVNAQGTQVYSGTPQVWSAGAEDASSGDKAWWFDFSSVTSPGDYYVLDVSNNVRSYEFKINEAVYNEVLKHAVRTFFYQRAGFEKQASYAGVAWADGASHTQDVTARAYNDINNAATEKDVSGGWYDAGDYNKYTNWTASYIIQMMLAYLERPDAWTDDYNIPESGNAIPDLLDEAKWGTDFLLRMQQNDGSVLSIVDLDHASPPSAATGPSYYGAVNTSSAQSASAAFAVASKVYRSLGMTAYADTLVKRAEMAWDWSAANPNVIWNNNDSQYGSAGIGAGQQEQSDYDRHMGRLKAAVFLFDATGETQYRDYFDANYQTSHLFQWTYAYPFEGEVQDMLLYYTSLQNATSTVKSAIISKYKTAMNGTDNFQAYNSNKDPFRAYIKDYTWGSNNIKSIQGNMFYNIINYNIDATLNTDSERAAMGFVNYIHGVNPLSFVYLSNMYDYGAENGVNEFFHTWFFDKNSKWDRVGVSTHGPAPGFLTGGPNPFYDWDGCCPTGCGSAQSNAVCASESITPPKGQPQQKSYKDFNTSWPLNSWSVTENSNGYQISYIRLLSKFVNPGPVLSVDSKFQKNTSSFEIFPNPTTGIFSIKDVTGNFEVTVMDITGTVLKTVVFENNQNEINLSEFPAGTYMVKLSDGENTYMKPLIKM